MPDDACNHPDSRSRPLQKRLFIRAACCLSIPSLVLVWFAIIHVQQLTAISATAPQAQQLSTADQAKTLSSITPSGPHAPKSNAADEAKSLPSIRPSVPHSPKPNTASQEKTRSGVAGNKGDVCSVSQILQDTSLNRVQQHCKGGPFGASMPGPKRRLAIMVRGETFKEGGLHDRRTRVNNKSFAFQKRAADSQVEFLIEPFEACGYHVDVLLFTWFDSGQNSKGWPHNVSQQLIDMYKGRVAFAAFMPPKKRTKEEARERWDPQKEMFGRGLGMMADYSKRVGKTWDAILVIRFDLQFKQALGKIEYDKILFAFVQADPGWGVADVIHWMPWRYVNCMWLDGFRQHYQYQIITRIGRANVNFLINEPHDSNPNLDLNPLFQMSSRAEQRYDIKGGHDIAMFSVRPVNKLMVEQCAFSYYTSLFLQGAPRAVPPNDIVLHMWKGNNSSPKAVDSVLWVHPVGARKHDILTLETGWQAAFESIRRSFKLATHAVRYKEKTKWRVMFNQPEYHLERLVFVRFDYEFIMPYISVYKCSIENRVCVGYGASKFTSIPVMIVASEPASERFWEKSPELAHMLVGKHPNATGFLTESFGLPVHVLCKRC